MEKYELVRGRLIQSRDKDDSLIMEQNVKVVAGKLKLTQSIQSSVIGIEMLPLYKIIGFTFINQCSLRYIYRGIYCAFRSIPMQRQGIGGGGPRKMVFYPVFIQLNTRSTPPPNSILHDIYPWIYIKLPVALYYSIISAARSQAECQ